MAQRGGTKVHLEGVEETLLIPLWARATETRRRDAIIRDEHAVRMVETLDYDFTRFSWVHPAIAVRTELLDKAASAFLAGHPDAVVVNLGAGLDTRFFRLDNGRVTWYEVDLPRSMALRRQLIPNEDRHRYVEGSVLEAGWLEAIDAPAGTPVLIIAEGLLMYFKEAQVRELIARLAARFPGSELLFETFSPLFTPRGAARTVLNVAASFKWGLWSGRELESWLPGLRWAESWCLFDHRPERWGPAVGFSFVPFLRSAHRIEHVRLPG